MVIYRQVITLWLYVLHYSLPYLQSACYQNQISAAMVAATCFKYCPASSPCSPLTSENKADIISVSTKTRCDVTSFLVSRQNLPIAVSLKHCSFTCGFVDSQVNPSTTDDAFWCRLTSATCYQLAQSVLKIGSGLAERVGQGEVGGCTPLADSAWWLLQLAVEKLWSAPGGPLTGVENAPFTL